MTPTHQASAQGRVESKSWTQAKALTRALFSACGTQNSEATLPSDFKVQVKHPISGLMTTLYEQGDVILPNSSVFMLTDRSRLLLPEGMAEDGIATLINMATAILEAVGLYLDGLFASESIAHIPALVYRAAELDGRWVLLYGNEFIELFTGVPLSQLIGPHAPKQLVELIHPEDLPSVLSLYDRTKTTSQVAQFEYRLQGADGHYRWVTEYVQYTDKSGFKQCASIVIPQGEKRRPTQSMALFESVSDVAQDVGLQTGQSFLEHFCRRLYIMCGAERMVLVSPLASGWWQTIVVTETSTVYPNYDFQVGTDDLLDSWALNIPSERLSENKYAELLIEGHRYVSIVPLRSIRETMTACLVLASDSLISRVDILNQYIELFSVRVLREIKQTNAMQQLDQQNRLLLRQKTELTELVSLLGKLEWVQCENEFIRQVDVCLHNAFTLSYCYWCFWQSGEWFRATLPVDEQRHWYEENKAIQEVRIIQQLEKVRHSDNLQVFTVNQVSV